MGGVMSDRGPDERQSRHPPADKGRGVENADSASGFSYSRRLTEADARRAFRDNRDAAGISYALHAFEEPPTRDLRSLENIVEGIIKSRGSAAGTVSRLLEERRAAFADAAKGPKPPGV